ncbi:MAG: GNAT family N-acetyltransferase [Bacteroidota bacterium]|nr:GNAT family N-acetyltransferase [Bacteroidota bacterium]
MPVKPLGDIHKESLAALASEAGSVFNFSAWTSLYSNELQHFGVFDNDNKLIAAFYLYKGKQMGLTHYKNPPYTPHIGLFYKNRSSNKANALTFDKLIISELADHLSTLSGSLITLALPPSYIDTQPFVWKKFKVIPNYTYHVDMSLSANDLMQNMASDKRNSLKKAEKDGVITRICEDKNTIEQLILKTFERKQKAADGLFIHRILHEFATKENSFAFVSYLNDKPVSTAFCIFDSTTCYYLLGGYDNENKHQGAGVSSIWNCLLHAKEKGLKKFDFEGSMLPEVEKFFRGFGGDLVPYYTINKAALPVEMGLKFIKRELF